jgi:predicted dehydrogenase
MNKVWLVGAGPMGEAHSAVMVELGMDFTIVGQGRQRAEALALQCDRPWECGGIAAAADKIGFPDVAVVALPVDRLASAALELVRGGTRRILLEKPGGLDLAELSELDRSASAVGAEIFIAYNRRFMASTAEVRRRLSRSGSASSMIFEFTEIGARIPVTTPASIKARWALANSSHVIDLAFHLCGEPRSIETDHGGARELDWHPSASYFRGFGTTTAGTAFSYHADWRGPGRWALEVVLPAERLILRPLETLQSVKAGRFEPDLEVLDTEVDRTFKPGLLGQMAAFMDDRVGLLSLSDHVIRLRSYAMRMWGYEDKHA